MPKFRKTRLCISDDSSDDNETFPNLEFEFLPHQHPRHGGTNLSATFWAMITLTRHNLVPSSVLANLAFSQTSPPHPNLLSCNSNCIFNIHMVKVKFITRRLGLYQCICSFCSLGTG